MITFLRYINQHPEDRKSPSPETLRRLRTLVYGYRSTMDAPLCDLIPELVAAFPQAKFILTVRVSQEVWWRSWSSAVGVFFENDTRRYTVYRSLIWPVRFLRRMDDMVQELNLRLKRDWGSIGPHMYQMHNQQVRDLVPKGQLLEYNVQEGWGPLCDFLNVDVPNRPFPKLNEADSIKAIMIGQQVFGAATWLLYLGIIGAAVYLAVNPRMARSLFAAAWTWWARHLVTGGGLFRECAMA